MTSPHFFEKGSLIYGQHRQALAQIYDGPHQISSTGTGGTIGAAAIQAQLNAQQNALLAQITPHGAIPESPVEDAGIKVGEIMAWRCWDVQNGWLYSVVRGDFEWTPGEVVHSEKIDTHFGIHAFKTRKQAMNYMGAVVGRVALWGTIYEFEAGWHAEFARIVSIDHINMDWLGLPTILSNPSNPVWRFPWARKKEEPALIDQLRETYGLTEAK